MNTLPVSEIIVGTRYRQDLGDIAGLAKSIADVGLLQPVVVTKDKRLVAGARRLAAVCLLGWTDVPVLVMHSPGSALLALHAERDENACRKELMPSEAAAIGAALEAQGRTEAEDRQAQAAGIPAARMHEVESWLERALYSTEQVERPEFAGPFRAQHKARALASITGLRDKLTRYIEIIKNWPAE
jgi:ParB-like chromosome segregation protein Spo0J